MDLGLSFEVVDAQLAEVSRTPVFKRCGCCERTYTRRQWLKLQAKAPQLDAEDPAFNLSLRDCSCGSTLAVLASDEALSHGLSEGVTVVDLNVRFPRGWGGAR